MKKNNLETDDKKKKLTQENKKINKLNYISTGIYCLNGLLNFQIIQAIIYSSPYCRVSRRNYL